MAMKSVCYSVTMVGMILARCAVVSSRPSAPAREHVSPVSTGDLSAALPLPSDTTVHALIDDSILRQDAIPSEVENANDNFQPKDKPKKQYENLPREIRRNMINNLDVRELGQLSLVSKTDRAFVYSSSKFQALADILKLTKVETAIGSDIGQLWDITKNLFTSNIPFSITATVAPYKELILAMRQTSNQYGNQWKPTNEEVTIHSISVIIGALVVQRKFNLLKEYIAKIISSELFDDDWINFVYLIALELELDGLKDDGISNFSVFGLDAYRCANELGFKRAAEVLANEYRSEDEDWSPDSPVRCEDHIALYRQVNINISRDEDERMKVSVSYLAHRSTLPNEPALSGLVFEDTNRRRCGRPREIFKPGYIRLVVYYFLCSESTLIPVLFKSKHRLLAALHMGTGHPSSLKSGPIWPYRLT
ncbi:hypothetical protein BJ085DRAFT_27984 [Dimargaris cristalligena]|uniref:F-box domain-containing protein n=1 Tax=Dimargaris cristalligena TaxID=215637 RepID=A0A4P9ZZB1_9FUNG|nr:hypothetical protein BJ085DRAFT_27984 [Dimargaris cristalligena]|eukprot:RKP39037.1 hypothetical protein BJ085DRAFT_27984 [Dimargaris cristalligena]